MGGVGVLATFSFWPVISLLPSLLASLKEMHMRNTSVDVPVKMEGHPRERRYFGVCQEGNEGRTLYRMGCSTVLKNTPGEALSALNFGSAFAEVPVSENMAFI